MGRFRRFLALRAEFDTVGQKWWQVALLGVWLSCATAAPCWIVYRFIASDTSAKTLAWHGFWGALGAGVMCAVYVKVGAYLSRPVKVGSKWPKFWDNLEPVLAVVPFGLVMVFGGPFVYNLLPFLQWVCPMP